MDAVRILRDIRIREANMLRLIAQVAKKDRSIASAFFNYSFDVQQGLRGFTPSMQQNLIDAFYENTQTIFRMRLSISQYETDYASTGKNLFGSNVADLTPFGKIMHEIKAEERKILLLMRELAVKSPDTMKTCCGLNDCDMKKFREISVDSLVELSFQNRQATIFRLKFDTKKLFDEFIGWLSEPVAVGLFLDKAV